MNLQKLLILAIISTIFSCSTSEDVDSALASSIPTIDFSVPSGITTSSIELSSSGSLLVSSTRPSANILERWANRAERIIDNANGVLERLNESNQLEDTGTFQITRLGSTISGEVSELSDNSTYSKEAVLCNDDQPYMYIMWNDDGTEVQMYRDSSYTPISSQSSRSLVTHFVYSENSENVKTLTVNMSGNPFFVPSDVESDTTDGGTYLSRYGVMTLAEDGAFTMTGVNAWEAAARDSSNQNDPFTGDAYLVGYLNSDGTGSYVATRRFDDTTCGAKFPFDESDPTGSTDGFCWTASIAADSTVSYQTFDSVDYDSTMQSLGVASEDNITYVSIPSTVSCPTFEE